MLFILDVERFILFKQNVTLSWGRHRFISWDELLQNRDQYLPNDTLNIYVKVKALANIEIESGYDSLFAECTRVKLNNDFSSILESGQFADVTFVVGSDGSKQTKFHAHKVVLFTRFPYFAKLFKNQDNLIEISIADIEPEVFNEILRFVYSGTAHSMDRLAKELLAAAHKVRFHSSQSN